MNIYIDNVRMDTDERTVVSLTLAVTSVSDPEKNRAGYSTPVVLPVTSRNRKVMGACDQIHSPGIFNHTRHTARVEKEDCVVMEGTATLLSCTACENNSGNGLYYRVAFIGGAKIWASYAASIMLRALGIGFERTLSATTVFQSWTWDDPVRFLPVQRDGFQVSNYSSNLITPAKILSFEDYHPFLHLKTLLDRIFAQAGYRLSSKFMESAFFHKLHISGNYPSTNADSIKSRMDFKAGRFTHAAATADSLGRVYANPYITFSTVGNLVESADPDEVRGGEKITGVYDKGGCFVYDGERIAFVPQFEVVAAFEYRIYYTTGYRIKNRGELAGFSSVNLDDGQSRSFALTNRNADRRDEFANRKTYTLVVFDHTEGSQYYFAFDEFTGSTQTEYLHTRFSARTATVTINSSYEVSEPKLYLLNNSGGYVTYTGDWAIYDGYVQQTGTIEVELRVRSAAERILPSRPKFFDAIYFGGAEQGMSFTLSNKTTVRPIFTQYPTLGSKVKFEDVAALRVTCLEMVKAVKHLFNLKFYTDELSKTVIAEPPEGFYTEEPIVDWSDKIDRGRLVVIKEPSENTAAIVTYCYRSGDGAVTRHNQSNGETIGKWSVEINNNLVKTGEQTIENGMFTASLNRAGDYPDAPDASLLQAGDRDSTGSEDMEDLNFLPKIVSYEGMRALPSGQRWGWPSNGTIYPYLSFHHTREENNGTGDVEPFTLCFENRDGLEGLNTYRDEDMKQLRGGKRIEVYMNLGPQDIEPLIRPSSMRNDFRGLYKLRIGGESALYRLEEVSAYSPAGNSPVKCVFLMKYPLS